VFHQDVQAQVYLDNHPNALVNALADERLNYVLYDPEAPPTFRLDRMPPAARRRFWKNFEMTLRTYFDQMSEDPVLGRHLWIRKASVK
jgi:hypothetical protein